VVLRVREGGGSGARGHAECIEKAVRGWAGQGVVRPVGVGSEDPSGVTIAQGSTWPTHQFISH